MFFQRAGPPPERREESAIGHPMTSMQNPSRPEALAAGASASAMPRLLLRAAFAAVLLLRFVFPFRDSPLSHIYSDPQRHLENGIRLFHPTFMGSSDPLMYQVWIWLLSQIHGSMNMVMAAGTGLLCAAMPYGWYRALRELLPRGWALAGGVVIGLVPAFLSIYAYFMNETLLLSLTGFAFWATFRAQRKRTVAAFAAACALWLLCGFTRTVALPMGLLCLLSIWLPQPDKLAKMALGVCMVLVLAIPAGMHGRMRLGYFAPFGNPYLPQVYQASGNKTITIDLGRDGGYGFGSPSFYNPTFYPFSDWMTDRDGNVAIHVDLSHGRADWIAEKARVERERTFPLWRGYWENFLYLCFAQSWPDNDLSSLSGRLAVWTRWIWPPLILLVALGVARGRFRGREWLLPLCGLGVFFYLMVQHEGVMEGRYRKPVDPVIAAAAVVLLYRVTRRAPRPRPLPLQPQPPPLEPAASPEVPEPPPMSTPEPLPVEGG